MTQLVIDEPIPDELVTYWADVYCRYCGRRILENEFDSHDNNCISRQAVGSYFKQDFFNQPKVYE